MVVIAPTVLFAQPAADGRFEAAAATAEYLASLSADARARSDAYFEGGYWIGLWGMLLTVAIMWLLLHTGLSRRMREAAARLTRVRAFQVAVYWVMFFTLTTVVVLPWSAYTGYVREHQYGLSTQTLGAWLGDEAKAFALGLAIGGVALMGLYRLLRTFTRTWWIWGAVFLIALQAAGATIFPVFVAPIFNTYTRLEDPAIRDPILRLARANGIHATDVWQVDASRQTNRISANVSGMLGTERITLNDNLLARCSQPCVEAVMGHEIGHYVLNHVYEMLLALGLVIVVSFAFAQWAFDRLRLRWPRWGVEGIGDPAGLPLLMLLLTLFTFTAFPVINTIIRTNEQEADVFGLNTARQPDGFAEAALRLAEYRKMEPSTWEEYIFYDHPSGRTRIYTAMVWKQQMQKRAFRLRNSARQARTPGSASASAPLRSR